MELYELKLDYILPTHHVTGVYELDNRSVWKGVFRHTLLCWRLQANYLNPYEEVYKKKGPIGVLKFSQLFGYYKDNVNTIRMEIYWTMKISMLTSVAM